MTKRIIFILVLMIATSFIMLVLDLPGALAQDTATDDDGSSDVLKSKEYYDTQAKKYQKDRQRLTYYLFPAYTIIWVFIIGFVISILRRQRKLEEEVHELENRLIKK
jgi:CcmD family protein